MAKPPATKVGATTVKPKAATMNSLVSKIFGNTLTCVGNDGSVAAADGEGRATDLIDLSNFYSGAEGNYVDIEGSPPAAKVALPLMLEPVLTPSVVATQGSLNKSKNVPNQSKNMCGGKCSENNHATGGVRITRS